MHFRGSISNAAILEKFLSPLTRLDYDLFYLLVDKDKIRFQPNVGDLSRQYNPLAMFTIGQYTKRSGIDEANIKLKTSWKNTSNSPNQEILLELKIKDFCEVLRNLGPSKIFFRLKSGLTADDSAYLSISNVPILTTDGKIPPECSVEDFNINTPMITERVNVRVGGKHEIEKIPKLVIGASIHKFNLPNAPYLSSIVSKLKQSFGSDKLVRSTFQPIFLEPLMEDDSKIAFSFPRDFFPHSFDIRISLTVESETSRKSFSIECPWLNNQFQNVAAADEEQYRELYSHYLTNISTFLLPLKYLHVIFRFDEMAQPFEISSTTMFHTPLGLGINIRYVYHSLHQSTFLPYTTDDTPF